MPDPVFISHATADSEDVNRLTSSLRQAFNGKVRTFNTSDGSALFPGDSWRDRIVGAIRGSSAVILWATSTAIESREVIFELGAATALSKPIIPCCVHIRPEDLPCGLDQVQALVKLDSESGWVQLADVIAQHTDYAAPVDRAALNDMASHFKAPTDALEITVRGLTVELENKSQAAVYEVRPDGAGSPSWAHAFTRAQLLPNETAVILRERGDEAVEFSLTWRDVSGAQRNRTFGVPATGARR